MDAIGIASAVPGHRAVGSASQTNLAYHVYASFQEACSLRRAWNDLAERAGDLLCSYDWCEVWWKYFSRWRRLEIHTLHDGPRLVAVLPLFRETIRPGGVWLRTVRLLGCDYTIHTVGLAIEPAYAERFMTCVLDTLDRGGPWDILQMGPLRPYNTVTEPIARAFARDLRVQTVIVGRHENWCTLLDLPETYEAYLHSLPSDQRCNILRRQRKLQANRDVTVSTARTPDQVRQAMDALVHWHQRLWTSRGQPGSFGGSPDVERFHRELAQRLAGSGQLVLVTLSVDGKIIGADYGYHFGKRTHGLFRGYCNDPQWRPYGLGIQLHCQVLQQAIDHGSTILDGGSGVFDYKMQLGGQLHGQRSLVAVHSGRSTRLRFWAALRTAYLIHLLYSRVWVDMVAPRLGILPKGCHCHLRYGMLAQLFRRVRLRLFRGPTVVKARCLTPLREHSRVSRYSRGTDPPATRHVSESVCGAGSPRAAAGAIDASTCRVRAIQHRSSQACMSPNADADDQVWPGGH